MKSHVTRGGSDHSNICGVQPKHSLLKKERGHTKQEKGTGCRSSSHPLVYLSPSILISHRVRHCLLRIHVVIGHMLNGFPKIHLISCFGAPDLCQGSVL